MCQVQEVHTEHQDGGKHRGVCAVAGCANSASPITGTLHKPAPAKMASTHISVLSKGALHILRILKSNFSFTSKCIHGARPVAWPLSGHFFYSLILSGLHIACSLPSSGISKRRLHILCFLIWPCPQHPAQIRGKAHPTHVSYLEKTLSPSISVLPAKVLLGEGSDHVLQVSSGPMTSSSLWTCPGNTTGQACPHLTPKTESLHQSTASPIQMLFAV